MLGPDFGAPRHNFVFSLYEGMCLAQADLAQGGIYLNLQPFDTYKNALATRRILETKALQASDLIIGPLYNTAIDEVLKFSNTHEKNVLSPMSMQVHNQALYPYYFLFNASYLTSAKAAAAYANKVLKKKTPLYSAICIPLVNRWEMLMPRCSENTNLKL